MGCNQSYIPQNSNGEGTEGEFDSPTVARNDSTKTSRPVLSKEKSSTYSLFLTDRRKSEEDSRLKWDERMLPSGDKRELLRKALIANPLFKQEAELRRVSTDDIDRLVASMRLMKFNQGEIVYKTGEIENQLLYIVEDGCFQLFRADAPAAKYSSGVFGEVEFLSGVPRQNTAISQPTKKGTNTSSSAYALRRDDYERVVEKGRHMDNIVLFNKLTQEQKQQLKKRLLVSSYRPGEMIVRKGESVKCFFIILSGEVKYDTNPLGEGSGRMTSARITDDTEDATDVDSGASDSAQVLGENDFFGAESVLNDAVQAASVRAITNTAVCKMDRSLFFNEKAYGPMRKIVSKAIKDREEDQKSRLQGADRFIRPQGSSRKVKKGDPERLSKWDDPSDEHEGSTPAARRFKKLDDDDPPEYSGFSCGVFSINLL